MNLQFAIFDLRLNNGGQYARRAQSSKSQIANRKSQIRSRGFSFTELLFAVFILGIGFIMIAAIFPVGLTQTKANFDESQASAVARAAVGQLEKNAYKADYVADGQVHALQTAASSRLVNSAESNMICAADSRYAWVGMYRRKNGENFAQVLFVLANRSDPYKFSDVATPASANVLLLEPRPVSVSGDVSTMTVGSNGAGDDNASNNNAAAPGTFVVIASLGTPPAATLTVVDKDGHAVTTPSAADQAAAAGRLNGRVYRLGNPNGGAFDYWPGGEFTTETFAYTDPNPALGTRTVTINSLQGVSAYIVGRNRISSTEFDGNAQDVAFYTSFISLK